MTKPWRYPRVERPLEQLSFGDTVSKERSQVVMISDSVNVHPPETTDNGKAIIEFETDIPISCFSHFLTIALSYNVKRNFEATNTVTY